MKTRLSLMLGGAILLCVTLATPARRAQAQPAQKTNTRQSWEYRVVMIGTLYADTPAQAAPKVERQLNDLGADGWELVWMSQYALYLKRPK